MTTIYKVPLQPAAQSFQITLGQTIYNVTLKWNWFANCWVIDFSDQNNVPILGGVPLITGVNLLEQYDYLNFPGKLIAQTDSNPDMVPSYKNLGSDGNLYFVTQ